MANDSYRNRLISSIRFAYEEYKNSNNINHSGLQGRIREIALNNLFKPLLIDSIAIGTGKIIDSNSSQSHETDLIIYNKNILPPLFYNDFNGLFPIESCLYTIEVKSTSSVKNIKDAISKTDYLINNLQFSRDYHNIGVKNIIPVYFAFSSDLSGTNKTEIDRYIEHDKYALNCPIIKAICIIGQGYWYYDINYKNWIFHPPTQEFDEVIDFLSGILNTIPKISISRFSTSIGEYLMDKRLIR